MIRFRLQVAPLLVLLAFPFGLSAFGQDLFEQKDAERKGPLTAEQKAAGEKESIF